MGDQASKAKGPRGGASGDMPPPPPKKARVSALPKPAALVSKDAAQPMLSVQCLATLLDCIVNDGLTTGAQESQEVSVHHAPLLFTLCKTR